jgi:Family of unknown function (DUF5677)
MPYPTELAEQRLVPAKPDGSIPPLGPIQNQLVSVVFSQLDRRRQDRSHVEKRAQLRHSSAAVPEHRPALCEGSFSMTIELMNDEWKRFAERLRRSGYDLLLAANSKLVVSDKGAGDPNIIAATLLCRSLTHLKAMSLLLTEGLMVEARTIVRNSLENAFWLAAIAEADKRDEALRRMADAELFSRHQIGQFAMQLRGEHDAEENEALRDLMQQFKGQTGSSGPAPKELAKLGKFRTTYLFYAEYSRDAHPTLHSLTRYLSRTIEEGEVIKCLDVLPPARAGDEFTIQHGCQAVLSAMFAANEIWSAGQAVMLTKLANEYSALAGLDISEDEKAPAT